ncbi:hypothetical protein BCR43DRAFT_525477 [Syncephalastrum racemosum]|uniref:Uncharacterized protein n=1 Tax=Syncephalastrum racemosum TaxID=13706 RepID=A0A1X2HAY9_SYNRA|nr:hypothetical protein BCR43DRAFT_525477 [Syncephalastrum racemosum]
MAPFQQQFSARFSPLPFGEQSFQPPMTTNQALIQMPAQSIQTLHRIESKGEPDRIRRQDSLEEMNAAHLEPSTEALREEDNPAAFFDPPRNAEGKSEREANAVMKRLDKNVDMCITWIKRRLPKHEQYPSWRSLSEGDHDAVVGRFVDEVRTALQLLIDKCEKNWMARCLLIGKFDNIRDPAARKRVHAQAVYDDSRTSSATPVLTAQRSDMSILTTADDAMSTTSYARYVFQRSKLLFTRFASVPTTICCNYGC